MMHAESAAVPNIGVEAAAELAGPNPKLGAGEELAPKPKPELCNSSSTASHQVCCWSRCCLAESQACMTDQSRHTVHRQVYALYEPVSVSG